MEMDKAETRLLVVGATGYIGARLVPRLLEAGYRVRVMARSSAKVTSRPWGRHPNLEIVTGDILDAGKIADACRDCHVVYYLVHSMNPASRNFAEDDRLAARNMIAALQGSDVERMIYLAGLGEESDALSHHLDSRREVETILQQGPVPVTVLRAAMIIGSGSASFEILRYLVERLPVMVTPRWVQTECQPIGIRNVLHYLVGCLDVPETVGQTFDIGQEQVVTYRELMEIFAEEAGLPRRLIIPVPVLTPRLSSYWIHLVTPVPAALARPLAEGLSNRVVCSETRIRELLPQPLFDCRKAIRLALEKTRSNNVESSWFDSGRMPPVEAVDPGDPEWAGGTTFVDRREIEFAAGIEEVWGAILGIGGRTGWYYADWLWEVRGFMDRLVGGVGLQRGRRSPLELMPGDALDFWRVVRVEKYLALQLVAEMKVPGEAVLEFVLDEARPGIVKLTMSALFRPRGLFGLLYWYAVLPFHAIVFNGMLKGIGRKLGLEVVSGPRRPETEKE